MRDGAPTKLLVWSHHILERAQELSLKRLRVELSLSSLLGSLRQARLPRRRTRQFFQCRFQGYGVIVSNAQRTISAPRPLNSRTIFWSPNDDRFVKLRIVRYFGREAG